MSAPSPAAPAPSRLGFTAWNCLFALLALKARSLTLDKLQPAVARWLPAKATALGQPLVEQGLLAPTHRPILEQRVKDHLKHHNNDPKSALMAVTVAAAVRDALSQLDDAEWR